MQVVLLAGGLGTRLRSVVADRPKVMAEVAGRPFLEHLLDRLIAQGVRRVVLAVGYRHEDIRSHFGDTYGGVPLAYSVEDEPLGTGGAVLQALKVGGEGDWFVLNADTWLELDMAAMLEAYRRSRARLCMAVRRLADVGRFGALDLAEGRVTGFFEKGRAGPGVINAGVYLMHAEAFAGFDLPERFSLESDFLMPHVAQLKPLAFETGGDFIDIGIPEDYDRARQYFAGRG